MKINLTKYVVCGEYLVTVDTHGHKMQNVLNKFMPTEMRILLGKEMGIMSYT